MKVEIISRQLIKPSTPTSPGLREFKLSFFDEIIPPFYIPLILYYSHNEGSNLKQPEMCNRLKRSLSDALIQFYPLAGRIKGQSSIDCNDKGILYIEATVDAKLSDIIECTNLEVLDQFIPYKAIGYTSNAEEQLAIQTSLFSCGGIVIGICISHKIADACTLYTFLRSWAATARGDPNLLLWPNFDAAALFPARNTVQYKPDAKNPASLPPIERLVTKRFVFTASAIAALKAKVSNTSSSMVQVQPTRVEVVSALIWKCAMGKHSTSVAFHPVNLRGRIVQPPLPECSFGNLFLMAKAVVTNGEKDLVGLVSRLRAALEKIDGDLTGKLFDENGSEIVRNNFMEIGTLLSQENVQVLRFSSWCRLPLSEANFGWGQPSWLSIAKYASKNVIFLMDSRCPGDIEAWVVMNEQDMATFEKDSELLAFSKTSS